MNMVELSNGNVIQRSDMVKMAANELTDLMNKLTAVGKQVVIVESITEFFSARNLLSCINSADLVSVRMIAENRGIVITKEEEEQVINFNAFKVQLQERIDASKPVYAFARVPENWSVATHLKINTKAVYRVKDSSYQIGLKTVEGVWNKASKYWSDPTSNVNYIDSIQASGYNRSGTINKENVTIGCQTIQRYELEQLALHQGWTFPK